LACTTQKTNSSKSKKTEKAAVETSKAVENAAEKNNEEALESEDAKTLMVGIWRLDLATLKDDPEISGLAETERAEALKIAKGMMANVAFEFAAKGKMAIFMGQSVRRGTYTVKKSEGNVLTLETSVSGSGMAESDQITLTVQEKAMTMVSEKSKRTFRLVRGTPAPPPSDTAATP